MGTSAFAEEILISLIDAKYNLMAVYTQPDKKVGREQQLQKSAVKITAERNNIPVLEPHKFDEVVIQKLKNLQPELIVVAAYGKILPKTVLDIPQFGAINVHTSLLPKYRGSSPIHHAILNGEKETGVTIMRMDAGMDTGDILTQKIVPIEKDETTPELSQKLSRISSQLLLETLPRWISGEIKSTPQDETQATLCRLLEKADGQISWTDTAANIYNRYRAFHPWPGVYTFWEHSGTSKRIKLTKINHRENKVDPSHPIGAVYKIDEKIGVQTAAGVIILEELQLEGKANISILNFINGYPSFIGSILKS